MKEAASLLPSPENCGPILDYGAGKFARHAFYLRDKGYKVYAYDPFNGSDVDGYTEGTSNQLPKEQFEIVFTAFVLNVVPSHVEDEILKAVKTYARKEFHITRNMDIFDTVKKNLKNERPNLIKDFFLQEFANKEEGNALKGGEISDETILEFCVFGVQTPRGFQRIPELKEKGYTLKKKTGGWKLYTRGL